MSRTTPRFIHTALLALALGSSVTLQAWAADPVTDVSAPAVLATAQGETPGTRVELHSLKRSSGDILTLTFALVNDSNQPVAFGYNYVEKGKNTQDFASIGGTHLIDGAGKKKYLVLRDSDEIPLVSRGLADIPAQGRANLWAKFPAPPADVQNVTVIIPHFTPLDDVPISQ